MGAFAKGASDVFNASLGSKQILGYCRKRYVAAVRSSGSVLGKHGREVTEGDRSEGEAVPNTPALN